MNDYDADDIERFQGRVARMDNEKLRAETIERLRRPDSYKEWGPPIVFAEAKKRKLWDQVLVELALERMGVENDE